jgi:hypothetical protein
MTKVNWRVNGLYVQLLQPQLGICQVPVSTWAGDG